jgi:hypothetical protein
LAKVTDKKSFQRPSPSALLREELIKMGIFKYKVGYDHTKSESPLSGIAVLADLLDHFLLPRGIGPLLHGRRLHPKWRQASFTI